MRLRILTNTALLSSAMNFNLVGCAESGFNELILMDNPRPTMKPCEQLSEDLIVVSDYDTNIELKSHNVGFRRFIRKMEFDHQTFEPILELPPINKPTLSEYLIEIDPYMNDRNHASADWVQKSLTLIRSRQLDGARISGIIITTERLSMSEIVTSLREYEEMGEFGLTVGLSIPLGMLSYTIQSLRSLSLTPSGGYYYRVTNFWVPSPRIYTDEDTNPFLSIKNNSLKLFEYLTTDIGVYGSPIPRRDLDVLRDPIIASLVTVMLTPGSFAGAVDGNRPTYRPSARVEFSALSRQSILDFMNIFKSEYMNVNFGFNSILPEAWLLACSS